MIVGGMVVEGLMVEGRIVEELEGVARLLLVEDHDLFRQGMAMVFERDPEFTVVAQAGTLAGARGMDRDIDVAVVDLALPDGSGIELVRELSESGVSVLVLSATIDRRQFAWAADAGAAGVLHKSTPLREIVEAARRLKAGEIPLSNEEATEMLRTVSREVPLRRTTQEIAGRLTGGEREVLDLLAEGLDSDEIARRLSITVETGRTNIVNVLDKLGARSRLQALVFAVRHGLVEIR